jgi:ribonuclease J
MELVDLTHSIPEMQAVAITTPRGVVMHTGDWKFDAAPMIGPVSDYETLKKYGDGKVLAMVCDSTNVFVEGESGSEGDVRKHLIQVIKDCPQAVIVSTFASNLARVASILMAAKEAGRVVALAGRSLHRVVAAAKESGYLHEDTEFVDEKEAASIPRQDLLVISTGCQGEPRAALTRIARGEHPNIRVLPGDTVIFSSRKIPGNESRINWVKNQLVKKKVEIITDRNFFIHVSGHPAREELKRMYELVRPQIAIPTHGEAQHLREHAKLAKSLGVKETVEAHNGAIVWLEPGEASIIGMVDSGYIAIDGTSMIPTDGDVIRTRRRLRDEGAVFVSIALGQRSEVQLAAPGVLDSKEDAEFIEEWRAFAEDVVARAKITSDEKLREEVRVALRQLIKRELEKKPHIEVQVIRA